MVCPRCASNLTNPALCPSCGWTAEGAGPAGAASPEREKGWWQRNWKWVVPAASLVLLAAFVGGVLALVVGVFRSSDVYQEALARVRAHPEVVAYLGQPVEPGFLPSGSINISGSGGDARLEIPVSGPKGSGTIYLEAKREAGEWQYSRLLFVGSGGQPRIDMLVDEKEPQRF
jgi:hypothetical protein